MTDYTPDALGQRAMQYATSGAAVFPLKPRRKEPLTAHGVKDATTDIGQVQKWWTDYPNANIGLALSYSRIAIDVDPRYGGDKTMGGLEWEYGPLPETKRHITGSDDGSGTSVHYILALPEGVDPADLRGRLGPGVDIKKHGGYIVVPNSIHPTSGKPYVDATPDTPPAVVPPLWLAAMLKSKHQSNNAAPPRDMQQINADHPYIVASVNNELNKLRACPESGGDHNGRNNHLNVSALKLARWRELDREWLKHQLLQAMTDNGYISDVSETAALKTIASAFAAADAEPARQIPEGWDEGSAHQLDPDEYGYSTSENQREHGNDSNAAVKPPLDGMFSGTWLMGEVFRPLEFIVPNVIPEGASLLSAPPKAAKSFFALQLGIESACGGEFLGQILEQRPVLYLALEDGHRRVQQRARQILDGREMPEDFHVMLAVDPTVHVVAVIQAFLDMYVGRRPLIIVDTLGRVKPQKKRASDEPYLSDYAFASELRVAISAQPGAGLLANHHTKKGEVDDFVEAGSGTLGIAGAFDTILVIKRKRHEMVGTLLVSGRDVEEGRYQLLLDEPPLGGLRWKLDGPSLIDAAEKADEAAAEAATTNFSDRTQQVLKIVRDRAAEGLVTTAHDVAQQTGIEAKRLRMPLKRLCDSGLITRQKCGAYFVTQKPRSPE